MPTSRRRSVAALAIGCVLTVAACGSDEPQQVIGTDVSFLAPVAAGGAQSVQLSGVERGSGLVGVVLAHMLGSSQFAWDLFADELVDRDFHVLTFDFRGHGQSIGDRSPSAAALDLGAAVEKLRSLGATKIFVVGASMGGTAALVVAGAQKLEGVVSISAPASIERLDATAAVKTLDEPSLFLVGADDDQRYTDAARSFAAAAPQPKRLQIIDGTGAHGTDLLTEEATRQRVTDLILDFLAANRG
ncbi:MAG: alpha/beta hydrolase [Actinomycetota bacterium]